MNLKASTSVSDHRQRRWLCAAAVAALAAPMVSTGATAQTAPVRSIGVFTVLGDQVALAMPTDAPSDTRIERMARDQVDFKGIGFDDIVLREIKAWMQRQEPLARLNLFKANVQMPVAEQIALAAGAERAELPAWIVQAINTHKLDQILLVTRGRGPADIRTGNADSLGRGNVEGIGFYMDTLVRIQNQGNNRISEGMIAPYLQLRLQLMDVASGNIVRRFSLVDGRAMGAPEGSVVADPWTFLDAATKVRLLRTVVAEGMQRALPQVLAR